MSQKIAIEEMRWKLSFDNLGEKYTTKHVHRLHPYKGKFIPQLVEYFIDSHRDSFKKKVFFKKGDVILDPFCGSGTALVQAKEMGVHSIGVEVSRFNCMMADVKLFDYDLGLLEKEVGAVVAQLDNYESNNKIKAFEKELSRYLLHFNNKYFPDAKYRRCVYSGKINEKDYGKAKEKEFLKTYKNLVKRYDIKLGQKTKGDFLSEWFIKNVRDEINFVFRQIKKINNLKNKQALAIILSRTVRSCRATTHSDLATLKKPQMTTYYCWRHKKICRPVYSIKSWFDRYARDTLTRLSEFDRLKTDAYSVVIADDSRGVNIFEAVKKKNGDFYKLLRKQKIKGVFTSPPYVGGIDYHEQHAYAYDLFGFERKDEQEIGPLHKGKGSESKKLYVENVSSVLDNCKKFLTEDYDIFIVANDKFNLYPTIAERAGMKIVQRFERPVTNRAERNKSPYSECIFHLKDKHPQVKLGAFSKP